MTRCKKVAAALLFCCVALQSAYPQSPPVAGIVFDSLQTGSYYGQWANFLQNTATGNPDTWQYTVTNASCPFLPCNNYGIFATGIYDPTPMVLANLSGSGPAKIWQVVTNPFGSDTTSLTIDMDCGHLTTPPTLEILYDTAALPTITAIAYSNIWVNITEITIFGTHLTTPNKHSYSPSVTDSLLLPGPVWACGYYYSSNCFSTAQFCDTIQVPCFRPPVVALQYYAAGLQANFTDSVIATTGATWHWDFGDGDSSAVQQVQLSHTYPGPGAYTACLTVTDTCGVTTVCTNVSISGTSVEDPLASTLEIAPNPNAGQFSITGTGFRGTRLTYRLQTLLGTTLATGVLPIQGDTLHQPMDLDLQPGLYLLRLQDAFGRSQQMKMLVRN